LHHFQPSASATLGRRLFHVAAKKLLLQTLVGHFALLESVNPRKAAMPVAQRARQYARLTLKGANRNPAAWRREEFCPLEDYVARQLEPAGLPAVSGT